MTIFLMPSTPKMSRPKSISAYGMQFQMLHIKMISSCFNVVFAAAVALVVLVCVHSTALSVPRSCSLVDLKVSLKKIKCKSRKEKIKKETKKGKKQNK